MNDICKLTGRRGKFVKSHIIPLSLSYHRDRSTPIFQVNLDGTTTRRWSSWYDKSIVTADGEAILANIDELALLELQKHKFIWRSWGPMIALPDAQSDFSIRHVSNIDTKLLRIFFLSLLWRASVSSLREFSNISLPNNDLKRLKLMIVNHSPEPYSFYPIQIVQISTLGYWHNRGPFSDDWQFPDIPLLNSVSINSYRFYFEGLVVHMLRKMDKSTRKLIDSPLFVAGHNQLTFTCIPFEVSRQFLEMQHSRRFLKSEIQN